MRDYGIVSPRFWTGETGKQLRQDPQAQVLALYLMTSPHSNMLGVYYCPVMYMAHETGLGMEGASKALARLIEAGFCKFDEAAETVFVVKMAAYQIGESLHANDKRVVGIRKEVEKMASSPLKTAFLAEYGTAFQLTSKEAQNDSPLEAPSKPHRSQEQEQEQEVKKTSSSLSTAVLPTCPHRQILALYAKHLPNLPQPKPELWEGQRAKDLTARWRWLLTKTKQSGERYATTEAEGLDWFDRFFGYVAQSDFLSGRSGVWTSCDLGWLVKAENFAKVVQGNYENKVKEAA